MIGLGRFGGSVAKELVRLGFEVLGIDGRAEMVQRYADGLTHVAEADATSDEALAQPAWPTSATPWWASAATSKPVC